MNVGRIIDTDAFVPLGDAVDAVVAGVAKQIHKPYEGAAMSAPAVIEHQSNVAPIRGASMTPMDMLNHAVESGANIETLTKLMDLQERWEKNQARKAFDEAIASAKNDIPVIGKNKAVDFTSQKGRTNYRYEDLAGIAKIISPILAKNGLSYRYRTETANGFVAVTCIISHKDGHSEENTLSAAHDQSGNKNSIQAVGSTITYLQRYTLKAALGLAAAEDDDGKASTNTIDDGPISEEQVKQMRDLIEESGADIALCCEKWGVEALPDLPASKFKGCYDALKAWAAKQQRVAS
jgi:hypothetical protein